MATDARFRVSSLRRGKVESLFLTMVSELAISCRLVDVNRGRFNNESIEAIWIFRTLVRSVKNYDVYPST